MGLEIDKGKENERRWKLDWIQVSDLIQDPWSRHRVLLYALHRVDNNLKQSGNDEVTLGKAQAHSLGNMALQFSSIKNKQIGSMRMQFRETKAYKTPSCVKGTAQLVLNSCTNFQV